MTEKRFMVDDAGTLIDMTTRDTFDYVGDVVELLNAQHEENMNNKAEITRFKLIVSDIVDDLEKQAKSDEPIVISMDYVDWIKSELDLKLNGLKR